MRADEIERKVAGLLMVGFPGGLVGPAVESLVTRGVRSFVVFARNTGSEEALRTTVTKLQELCNGQAIIAIDQEGGTVSRLRTVSTEWPSQMSLAATGDAHLVEEAAYWSASQLYALGISWNFAPVADVLTHYRNPVVGTRAFSDDPQCVSELTVAAVRGHKRAGIACTPKHFPGHGQTGVDSHKDLPVVVATKDELLARDIPPFAAAIEVGARALMVSHVWYAAIDPEPIPASLSSRILALARNDLEFDGVIVSDCLEMGAIRSHRDPAQAAVQAVAAGCDVVAFSQSLELQHQAIDRLVRTVEAGDLAMTSIERSLARIARLPRIKKGSPLPDPNGASRLASKMSARAVTLVRNDRQLVPLPLATDCTIAIVTFGTGRTTPVQHGGWEPVILERMSARQPRIRHVPVSDATTEVEGIVSAVGDACLVLAVTAGVSGPRIQAETVRRLHATGIDLVVVAVRDPFDLETFPEVETYVAAYGSTPSDIEAVVQVLFGEQQPGGHLPVELPGLYPRGHGITRTVTP